MHKNHLISFLKRSCFGFETLISVATNSWNLIKNIKRLFQLQMLKRHLEPWTLARQSSHLAVTSPPTLPASDMKVSSHTCNLNAMWHDVESVDMRMKRTLWCIAGLQNVQRRHFTVVTGLTSGKLKIIRKEIDWEAADPQPTRDLVNVKRAGGERARKSIHGSNLYKWCKVEN